MVSSDIWRFISSLKTIYFSLTKLWQISLEIISDIFINQLEIMVVRMEYFFVRGENLSSILTTWRQIRNTERSAAILLACTPPSRGKPDGENPSPSTWRRKAFTIPAKEIQTGTGEDIQPMGKIHWWTRYICLSSSESLCCHLLHQHHRITWRNVIRTLWYRYTFHWRLIILHKYCDMFSLYIHAL